VKFWDSSAIVPLLVDQRRSGLVSGWHLDDPALVVWWATTVECESAIARLVRDGRLQRAPAASGLERLRRFGAEWVEVEPSEAIRETACRLLRAHPLRAADALQLAAALRFVDESGEPIPFVSFDDRLTTAARAESLPIVTA
jgi:predicted nucleic acid-binding protein